MEQEEEEEGEEVGEGMGEDGERGPLGCSSDCLSEALLVEVLGAVKCCFWCC